MADRVVPQARDLSRKLLSKMPKRWAHTTGVAAEVTRLYRALQMDQDDAEGVLAAAWLHDIGHAPRLRDTGFYPLDGALYLNRRQWSFQICSLVANQCGARFAAADLGLGRRLWPFRGTEGPALDLLTYAHLTVAADGAPTSAPDGITDLLGSADPHSPAGRDRAFYLTAVARRVEASLEPRGLPPAIGPDHAVARAPLSGRGHDTTSLIIT